MIIQAASKAEALITQLPARMQDEAMQSTLHGPLLLEGSVSASSPTGPPPLGEHFSSSADTLEPLGIHTSAYDGQLLHFIYSNFIHTCYIAVDYVRSLVLFVSHFHCSTLFFDTGIQPAAYHVFLLILTYFKFH